MLFSSIFVNCGNTIKGNSDKNKGVDTIRTHNINDTCLIYFEEEKSKFTCCIRDLKSGDTVHLAQFKTLPMDVLWDTVNNYTYFFLPEGIYKNRYDSIGIPEKISGSLSDHLTFEEAWMDSASGNIFFSYLLMSDFFNREQSELYTKLSAAPDAFIPGYGVACIVYVSELDTNGKFNIIAQKAYKTGAGMLYPFGEINYLKKRKQGQFSMNSALFVSTCMVQSSSGYASFIDSSLYAQYGIDKYPMSFAEGFIIIRTKTPYDIIVKTAFGDSEHYVPPVLAYNKNKKETTELTNIDQSQLGILMYGDYVLFAYEYRNSEIIVYNWKTQQLIYSAKNGIGGFIVRI
ncbi:MAG: hypothetical protein V1904_14475 [Bacteroidota bacterium]